VCPGRRGQSPAQCVSSREALPQRRTSSGISVLFRHENATGAAQGELGAAATEIAQALVERGFLDRGLRRIFATCDAENHASRRVLIKAGLRFESVIKRHEYAKNRWWDSELYAIDHDDRSTIRAGTAGVGHR